MRNRTTRAFVSITQKGITHNLVVLSSQTNKLVNMCVSRFGPKDDLAVFNYSLKRRTLLISAQQSQCPWKTDGKSEYFTLRQVWIIKT